MKDGRQFPKTKILGINTQAGNNMNWYLLKNENRYDPGLHIEWLQNELDNLEAINGSAIIICHIPTNGDVLHGWGHRFRGLMERYQNVVRFGLFGHTHDEEYSIVQSITGGEKNIILNYIAPSVTPYTDKNPSFTLIEIDEEYMVPLNIKI